MPTKTDRILSYLPGTFRALPQPTALYSVVDAFGSELLQAENSLAAFMAAHWVDHADRGAELVEDLDKIAALYGLAARDDETVEEFREHLKRYIRIFLDGPATVQGILRVAAEALQLQIYDSYAEMDSWWKRPTNSTISAVRRGDDAGELVFGARPIVSPGIAAQPAQITGSVDLNNGADLSGGSILRLQVDNAQPVAIDLASSAGALAAIIGAINNQAGGAIASRSGNFLKLTAPGTGLASRLEVADGPGDAAPRLLGLPPMIYHGSVATAAQVVGKADLGSGAINLSDARYLRLQVNGNQPVEIDCGGANPATRTLDQIRDAINAAMPAPVASHDTHFLKLTSPTTGFASSIAFLPAPAQDARERLFGQVAAFHAGQDERPAIALSVKDLGSGVDLSVRSKLSIQVDDGPAVTVDCAGADPARTLLSEVTAALNAKIAEGTASHDGRFLRVASPTTGPASTIAFEPLTAEEDATEILFGIAPRRFAGVAQRPAQVKGTADLTKHFDAAGEEVYGGVDLGALHLLQLKVDGKDPIVVNIESAAANPRNATLWEISAAMNTAIGKTIASGDGVHLILTSPTPGTDGSVEIVPMTVERRRSFVTRAFIAGEAASTVFGFISKEAQGAGQKRARVEGSIDLSRSTDLRTARFLRISIDGAPAKEIDCAGPRPRATLINEIVKQLNSGLGVAAAPDGVAAPSEDGKSLVLTSPSAGAGSRIDFEPPHSALKVLMGVGPGTFSGRAATRVKFSGLVDLRGGVDLSVASKIKLSIDGEEHEIDCAGPTDPAHTTAGVVVVAINAAFGGKQVARSEEGRIALSSFAGGEESRVEFSTPSAADATKLIFGIAPPRKYRGAKATPARVSGAIDLSGGIDVSAQRFLVLAAGGGPPVEIDCAAGAADPSSRTLPQIVATINAALTAQAVPAVAGQEGDRLVLETTGAAAVARLDLLAHEGGDARAKLLGSASVEQGQAAIPALLAGDAQLLAPVDLSERSVIRVAIDGNPPLDFNVAGLAPSSTSLDEIVAKINAIQPGLASAVDDKLQLTSPTRGGASRLALVPVRALELIDYPPVPAAWPADGAHPTQPGGLWRFTNDGAVEANLEVEISTRAGVVDPQIANLTLGQRVRVLEVVRPLERLKLWREPGGEIRAAIVGLDKTRAVPDSHILSGPLDATGATDFPDADKSAVLLLPRGGSEWNYLDCHGSRFDCDCFNTARFAGGSCRERAVFDVSHFASSGDENGPVFSNKPPVSDPAIQIRFRWANHQPGAFVVNLPAELPEKFGATFNQGRFAQAGDKPEEGERFEGVVTEPAGDPDYIVTRIEGVSNFVNAKIVQRVPLGFEAATMPFRKPRRLILGSETARAAIYLAEKDVPGFIELKARRPGAWGNSIRVVARKTGPALFDVTISFPGARFERARQVVLGGPLPKLTEDLLKPAPLGVLQAKAAGVLASVTRDRAEPT
jgi:hypothetical protein